MSLFNFKIFVCSNSTLASSSFESCIALCKVVNSGCLLKGLKTFVVELNELEIIHNKLDFRLVHYSDFSFTMLARECICKQTTYFQSLTLNFTA